MYWYVLENVSILVVQGTVDRGQTCIFICVLHFICFTSLWWAFVYGRSVQRAREQGLAGKGSYCTERLASRQSGTKGSISRMYAWELAFACFLSGRLLFVGLFSKYSCVLVNWGHIELCSILAYGFFFFFSPSSSWCDYYGPLKGTFSLSVEELVPRDLCHLRNCGNPFFTYPEVFHGQCSFHLLCLCHSSGLRLTRSCSIRASHCYLKYWTFCLGLSWTRKVAQCFS